jgi:hypothetical protein
MITPAVCFVKFDLESMVSIFELGRFKSSGM